MLRRAIVVIGCLFTASAFAQGDASKMTKDDLLAFLPGTKVTHISSAGSERHWTNGPDGKFVASSTNKLYGSALGTSVVTNPGTWTVNDEGKYCIDIDWSRVHEKWCAFVLKGADDTYYLNVVDAKHKIEFAK